MEDRNVLDQGSEQVPKLAENEDSPEVCPVCKYPSDRVLRGLGHHWIGCSRITPEQQAAYDARTPCLWCRAEPGQPHQAECPHENQDNWKHRSKGMVCSTCVFYVPKVRSDEASRPDLGIGRCRRHSPTMGGWPVMKPSDWCGDHKLDENKA